MTTVNCKTDGHIEQKSLSLIRVKVEDAARTTDAQRRARMSNNDLRIEASYQPRGMMVTD